MKGAIFLLQDDGLVEMTEQDYESENLLQEFLEKYPSLLAGDQIDSTSPRRLKGDILYSPCQVKNE